MNLNIVYRNPRQLAQKINLVGPAGLFSEEMDIVSRDLISVAKLCKSERGAALFEFFGQQEPKGFTYHPVIGDKDALYQKLKQSA